MTTETERLLASIDATLKAVLAALKAAPTAAAPPVSMATDADLDGKYGNPEIKAKDPRDWTGEPMKGRKMSECPAPYLDMVAERLDYFATTAETENKLTSSGKPVAPYNRADAKRARGWAARIRAGYVAPSRDDDAEITF